MTALKLLSRWIKTHPLDNVNLRIEPRASSLVGSGLSDTAITGSSIERIHFAGPRDLISIEEAYAGDRTRIRRTPLSLRSMVTNFQKFASIPRMSQRDLELATFTGEQFLWILE